jgi:hypothetical protein
LTRCSSTPRAETVAAPVLDEDALAGLHPHGVGREHVDDELEGCRVAELDEGRARGHHLLTLLKQAQHASPDRRPNGDEMRVSRSGVGTGLRRQQRRPRGLDIEGRDAKRGFARRDLSGGGLLCGS